MFTNFSVKNLIILVTALSLLMVAGAFAYIKSTGPAATRVAEMTGNPESKVNQTKSINPLLGMNINLPFNTVDPTITQAAVFYFFEGSITSLDKKEPNLMVNFNNKGAPVSTPLEIPLSTKVTLVSAGEKENAGKTITMDDLKKGDNIKISYNYDLKSKKLSVVQFLVIR